MNTAEFRGLFPTIITDSLFKDSQLDRFFYGLPDFWQASDSYRVEAGDSNWELEVPLPGSTKESVKISIKEGDKLSIKVEGESDRNNGISKLFKLPVGCDPERIEAEMKDGLLKVSIPKKQAYQDRMLEIK